MTSSLRQDSDKQTGMVDDFEDFFKRAKAGVPKTLVKRKLRLHSLYFPQNTLMLTESRGDLVICILFLDFARFAVGG